MLHRLFSGCSEQGLLSRCGLRASHCGGYSRCRARACLPTVHGIFLDQGSNPSLLHWQEYALPRRHQGSWEKLSLDLAPRDKSLLFPGRLSSPDPEPQEGESPRQPPGGFTKSNIPELASLAYKIHFKIATPGGSVFRVGCRGKTSTELHVPICLSGQGYFHQTLPTKCQTVLLNDPENVLSGQTVSPGEEKKKKRENKAESVKGDFF